MLGGQERVGGLLVDAINLQATGEFPTWIVRGQ